MRTVAAGVDAAVHNPVEFGKQVIDYDTWRDSPARAIGHLVPDAIAAVATGGTGAIGKKLGTEALEATAETGARRAASEGADRVGKADSPLTGTHRYREMPAITNAEILGSGLHLPLDHATIAEYAEKAGVDLTDVEVNIAAAPDDVRYYDFHGASASTAHNSINLAPAAFRDEETLMRNLVHERVHVDQYRDGRIDSTSRDVLEDEAYQADEQFWQEYTGGFDR